MDVEYRTCVIMLVVVAMTDDTVVVDGPYKVDVHAPRRHTPKTFTQPNPVQVETEVATLVVTA